eukprot:gene1109-4337_t
MRTRQYPPSETELEPEAETELEPEAETELEPESKLKFIRFSHPAELLDKQLTMSEERYLRRGAVYTRPAKSSERNPLEPRDVNDNAFYGSSGRIRHRGRKLALNGKTSWGQDDPLVETYPVGLRRRRLYCVLALVTIAGILVMASWIGTIWAFRQLAIDTRGMRSMVIKGNSVGLLREFQANDLFVQGDEAYIVRGSTDKPTVFTSKSLSFKALSQDQPIQSSWKMKKDSAPVETASMKILSEDMRDTNTNVGAESFIVSSQKCELTGNLLANKVMSKAIEAEAGTPLNIRSNGTLNVKSFREITMASQGGHVHILAQGPGHDITLLAATSIPTLAPFVETTVRGGGDGVFMHLDDIPRPDAVPIAGQLSFTEMQPVLTHYPNTLYPRVKSTSAPTDWKQLACAGVFRLHAGRMKSQVELSNCRKFVENLENAHGGDRLMVLHEWLYISHVNSICKQVNERILDSP